MIQGALEFQGLKDLGHGLLSNCQKFTCTQFVGAIYIKLDSTSLNEVSCAEAATKAYQQITVSICIFYILHAKPHKMIIDIR